MQVAKTKKKRKRRNYNSNQNRRAASASKCNDPLHSYDNTNGADGFTGVAGDDGFFGENPNGNAGGDTSKNNKEDKKMYMTNDDRTGRSTSGRKAWQEKHARGKFSKRYKKKSVEW